MRERFFCTLTCEGDRRTTMVVESTNRDRAARKAARIVSPETGGQGIKAKATPLA